MLCKFSLSEAQDFFLIDLYYSFYLRTNSGFAMEALITLLTPAFIAFFLVLWIIG